MIVNSVYTDVYMKDTRVIAITISEAHFIVHVFVGKKMIESAHVGWIFYLSANQKSGKRI